jgi:hypothetical protein
VGEFVEQVDDDTVQAISAWLDYFYHVTERLFLAEIRSLRNAGECLLWRKSTLESLTPVAEIDLK